MSIDLTGENDCTPLHYSALFGKLEATKILVERGADLNSTDEYGDTPMDLAFSNNKLEVFLFFKLIRVDVKSQQHRHCHS
jgi:ankyrin repeat protein